jgi:hypothetical protein
VADITDHKKRKAVWVIGIILAGLTLLSSWVAIWQTSNFRTQDSIQLRMDTLTSAVNDLQLTVARTGQRLDDYINLHK